MRPNMTIVSALLPLVFGALLAQACVTSSDPTQAIVMERSEQGRPHWVDRPRAMQPNSERWFVYDKSGIQRLELGIRQAQAAALANHCRLIADRMRQELLVLQAKIKDPSESDEPNEFVGLAADSIVVIDQTLAKIAESDSCPELELKEVYWERLRKISTNGPETSFSVYVLLRLKPIAFDEVLAMTAESLKLSGKADLAPLAAATLQLMSTSDQQGSDE